TDGSRPQALDDRNGTDGAEPKRALELGRDLEIPPTVGALALSAPALERREHAVAVRAPGQPHWSNRAQPALPRRGRGRRRPARSLLHLGDLAGDVFAPGQGQLRPAETLPEHRDLGEGRQQAAEFLQIELAD